MVVMQSKRADALLDFIVERHEVHRRKRRGEPKPWSTWPALQQFRFCNVYRELDTVTEWIADNWREPHAGDPDVWFAMLVARYVNWPDTLAEIGYPVPWEPARFVDVMQSRMARKQKVFTGAYMIHADLKFRGTKAAYLAQEVFAPLWQDRASLRPRSSDTLAGFAKRLMQYRDAGGFMVGQVVCDTKQVQPLRGASDWWTWAISGPGSRRGLNRVLGRDKDSKWTESAWWQALHQLHRELMPRIRAAKLRSFCAQDLQSCLCEFDKLRRVQLGEGKPRSRYPGLPSTNGTLVG